MKKIDTKAILDFDLSVNRTARHAHENLTDNCKTCGGLTVDQNYFVGNKAVIKRVCPTCDTPPNTKKGSLYDN